MPPNKNLIKNGFRSFLITTLCSSLFYCSSDEFSIIEVPSFGVDSLLNDMKKTIQSQTTSGAHSNQVQATEASCENELNDLNKAPQLLQANLGSVDYLEIFYSTINFYDCQIREQAEQSEVTILDSGQYISSLIDSNHPEDMTMFVSWIYDSVNMTDENEDLITKEMAKGKLVNLHLQDNNIRTKTRTDLSHHNGDRVVKHFHLHSFPAADFNSDDDIDFYTKVIIKEILDEEGNVVEQKIGARHYNTLIEKVVSFVAFIKSDVGSVVFLKTCATTDPDADCSLSNGFDQKEYYSPNGDASENQDGSSLVIQGLPENNIEDIGTDYELYIVDDFYDGQSKSDYLKPSFDPSSE